jgi:hypothetical protein
VKLCGASQLEGRGGGIYLNLPEGSMNGFHFGPVAFSENFARFGKNIYLEAWNLRSSAVRSKFNFSLGDDDDAFAGSDPHIFIVGINEANLLNMWDYMSSTIYVNWMNGTDRFVCGADTSPCKSVVFGLTRLEGVNRWIVLQGSGGVRGVVDVSGISMKSSSSQATSEIVYNPTDLQHKDGGLLTTHQSSSLSLLVFIHPAAHNQSQLISSSNVHFLVV